jgi:integrase
MSAGRKPAFTIREGSASVAAYKYRDGRFCLYYRKHAGAKPSRETKTGERAARDRAREIAIALANGRAEVLELTHADRESYLHAKSLLPDGLPLHEAIESFLKVKSVRGPSAPLPEIFAQFIRSKETMLRNGELSEVHVKKLRDDLQKFIADFPGPIGNYFTDDLQDWLNDRRDKKDRPVGPRRRRHLRDRINALYNFARDNGFLALNERTAAERTARPRVLKGTEPTFTPEQFDLLINAAHRDTKESELVPALAIAAFGRMRMSEISRLEYPAIHLSKNEIDVSSRVAGKTGNARIIEMPPNLVKWLQPYIRSHGAILDPKIGRIDNRVRRFAQKLGLKWKRNVLRGSCASYLYALTNDLKYVAAQLGTSERTLRREYLERKTKAEGEKWFAIAPAAENNVLELRWAVRE